MRDEISQAGNMRRGAGPEVDVAEGVGAARSDAAFIVVRKKFGFVGGEVDAYRTLAFAALAGEAEIERFFYFFAAPAVANDFPLRHFPEQVGATAGAVFFFARGAIAGAHQATFFAAALAYADAT